MNESFGMFDLTALPPGVTITGATLSFVFFGYLGGSHAFDGKTFEARIYDWGAALGTNDFIPGNVFSNYPRLAYIVGDYLGWVSGTRYNFTTDSGAAARLSPNRLFKFAIVAKDQGDGVAPVADERLAVYIYTGAVAGLELVVTYEFNMLAASD
jgi:hypothetical protein